MSTKIASFVRFHGQKLVAFEQWQRANYAVGPRDAAESDRRYRKWLLSFS